MPALAALRRRYVETLASTSPSPQRDVDLILSHVLACEPYQLITENTRRVSPAEQALIAPLIARRQRGEPIAYLTGKRAFMGLDFRVDARVLIPRPDSELLVECVIDRYRNTRANGLDIATGSGALAIATLHYCQGATMTASDIDEGALAVATQNAQSLGVASRLTLVASDLFAQLPEASYDFIISNPPYIRRDELAELMRDVIDFEPTIALDGGEDGLMFYRRMIPHAYNRLNRQGMIYLEIGSKQANDVADLLVRAGFSGVCVNRDLANHDRVVYATKE